MASAWGNSWGSAWGNAWGATSSTPSVGILLKATFEPQTALKCSLQTTVDLKSTYETQQELKANF